MKSYLALLLTLVFAARAEAQALVIRSVNVIDGTGAAPFGPVDIEIVDGKIRRLGPNLAGAKGPVIEGYGRTVTPGLIDAHVHLRSVPGGVGDWRKQLPIYLAAGVTTVLDAASPASLFAEVAAVSPAPRFRGLAPFLTPVGGYFSSAEERGAAYRDLWAPVATPADVEERFRRAASLGALGAKVTEEYGFGPFHVWPVFPPLVSKAIAAHRPLFVHSERAEEFRNALALKPYAFMHGGFFDEVLSDELTREIRASGAYVVSTLAIFRLMGLMWNREELADPWLRGLVPPEQLATALDENVTAEVIRRMAVNNKPSWCPSFIVQWLAPWFVNRGANERQLASARNAILKMYDAGIPIVMGSDSGNWPVLTTMFHGVGSVLEMEELREAGVPPLDVIKAATGTAARMLKIDGEVGTVREGQAADLLILGADPLVDAKAFRRIDFVIQDGVAKRPEEWRGSTSAPR